MNENIFDQVFEDNFDKTYDRLLSKSKLKSFSIEVIEQEYKDLCKYDGLAWTGRGSIQQAEIDSSIQAYQIFIKRWKNKEI